MPILNIQYNLIKLSFLFFLETITCKFNKIFLSIYYYYYFIQKCIQYKHTTRCIVIFFLLLLLDKNITIIARTNEFRLIELCLSSNKHACIFYNFTLYLYSSTRPTIGSNQRWLFFHVFPNKYLTYMGILYVVK